MQNGAQRRFRGCGTAQQIDKRVFEAWRSLADVEFRHAVAMANVVRRGLFFQDQTHRFSLNHAVANLRQF
ncbi:hypothetical protein SDC9_189329 [bioreactor metagenome]|uniref:Uncharacterized protein n=1 Tax=bioreactor metagenome TaxID=1076179 RepID=A0A645I034_9ZZZZ